MEKNKCKLRNHQHALAYFHKKSIMEKIFINPADISCFTEKEGSTFIVITSPSICDLINFEKVSPYSKAIKISVKYSDSMGEKFWSEIPSRSHILVILPEIYFQSPSTELLGPDRQLAVMACHSTPTTLEAIQHFIIQSKNTDSYYQDKMAESFFETGSASSQLIFEDINTGYKLTFDHTSDQLVWHEQVGKLSWGQQQLFPSGEISTLPVNVFGQNINNALDINGKLVLHGFPVLHGGNVSYLREDQARIFTALSVLEKNPVIAHISDGRVTKWEETSSSSQQAIDMLEALCMVDGRYRTIIEVGFGINTSLKLFPGNNAMNEVYGSNNGAVHIGFGIIPFTQYHLDIICPHLIVKDDKGIAFFGAIQEYSALS